MTVALMTIPLRSPASDQCDRAYGRERTVAIHASSCCRTHCVPRRCRDEPGGPPEARQQSTVRGVLRYPRAFALVWHSLVRAQADHPHSLAARHAQSRHRSTARRWRQWYAHAPGHQPQTIPLFWRRAKGGVRDSSSCCQKLMVRLSQCFDSALVYDALLDLPYNYEREQPLLRVSPVFPVP